MIDLTGIETSLKYEYSVHLWGEFFIYTKSKKFKDGYYVFSSVEERELFISELITYTLTMKQKNPNIVPEITHKYEEGYHVRLKHVLTFSIFYNGVLHDFKYFHPITMSEDGLLMLYLDSIYACDCYKKEILRDVHNVKIEYDHPDFSEEFACGTEIKYENLKIEQEEMTQDFIRFN